MLERIKSLTLVLLVGMSFYLTYSLWWNHPSYEPLTPPEYEKPRVIGDQLTWQELMQPQEVIFHYQENRHTKATLEMAIYQMVWSSFQRWQFSNPKEITLSREEGKEILENHSGLEFVFVDDLPINYYANVIQLPTNLADRLRTFNRIWVYETENETYKALFISDAKRKVVETTLIDLEEERGFSVRNLALLGAQLTEFQAAHYASEPSGLSINFDFFRLIYLPNERSYMNQWTYKLSTIAIEEMANALFLDVSAMKEIPERGDSRIFTDGTKSLRYNEQSYEMRFYLPTYEQGLNDTTEDEMYPIIDFMNQHHGWTGKYKLDHWINDLDVHGITFREYFSGYPIYCDENAYGLITLKLQYNQVNEYIRSLLRMESSYRGYQIQIKSGTELLNDLIEKNVYLYTIKQIKLGYKTVINREKNEVDLIPHYIIMFHSNRAPLLIDARVQNMEE